MAQYVEIISVVATPSPAPAGSRVDVVIKVRNLYSSPLTIMSQYNCGSGGPQPYYVTQPDGTVDRGSISPGQELTVLGAFTMGDSDITIYAYSWWYGSDGQYHFDDQKQITVSVQSPGQTYSARLDYIRLELEDGSQLPVSPLPTRPINTLAKVRVFATNTSTVKENIRAKVTVYSPDGLPLPDIYDNTSHGDFPYNGVSAGAQTQIVSSNLFGLTKPGTWTVHIDLLAGEGNLPGGPVPTQVVFSVDIPICTVPALTGSIIQSQVSINGGAETNIPAGAVALGSSGAIHVTVKNTNTGSVRMKLVIAVKDATANNLTPTPVTSPDISPGGTHKLTSEQFKFNQTGSYTVEAKLYALPEEVTPVASLPATKLCNDVPAGQTDTAAVNSLKIVGWGKLGGAISTSIVQLSPGDKLTVRVKINYSSPVADTTNSGTFAQLTYKRSELEKFVPVVGTTVTAPIPLPQALAPTDLTYDWTIPVGTGVESGQYDIKVGIPVTIGPGWADDTGNTFPIRVTTGSGGGMAEIPRDGLSIISWGRKAQLWVMGLSLSLPETYLK